MSNDSSPDGGPVEPTEPIPATGDPAVPPTTAMPAAAGATPPPPIGTDPNHAIPQDPPPPWYRENPAAVAVIVLGLIGIFALIAWLIWGGDDDDDSALIIDSSTTLEILDDEDITLGTVDTEPVDTTAPSSSAPPTTEPITTSVPTGGTAPLNTTTTTTVAATTTTTVAATTTTAAPATTTTVPTVTSPPNPDATVLDVINDTPDLSRLRELVAQAGLEDQLAAADPRTVFAPSNPAIEAFAATPEGAAILADPAQLEQLLLRHVALEAFDANAVLAATEIETATGDRLPVDADANTVDGGTLLVVDVSASNGFLHVVDRVLSAG